MRILKKLNKIQSSGNQNPLIPIEVVDVGNYIYD